MTRQKDESAAKKVSFLDPLRRVLDEQKKHSLPPEKEKEQEHTNTADNLQEAEPDVNDVFRPK